MKFRIFSLFLALSTLLFQNCGTIIYGTFKKIPATSDPPGAKIILNGEDQGFTPLNLHLKKTKNHMIRIEKEKYNPLEIIIRKEGSSKGGLTVAGDILVAGIVAYLVGKIEPSLYEYNNGRGLFMPKFIWGVSFVGLVALDYLGGGLYELYPAELQVTLTKIEGQARTNLVVITAGQLDNIKWIRIKCSDSQEEELIDLD